MKEMIINYIVQVSLIIERILVSVFRVVVGLLKKGGIMMRNFVREMFHMIKKEIIGGFNSRQIQRAQQNRMAYERFLRQCQYQFLCELKNTLSYKPDFVLMGSVMNLQPIFDTIPRVNNELQFVVYMFSCTVSPSEASNMRANIPFLEDSINTNLRYFQELCNEEYPLQLTYPNIASGCVAKVRQRGNCMLTVEFTAHYLPPFR